MRDQPADARLAAWAAHPAHSRGRRHAEAPPQHRSEFQRDRDRVIHAAAFRRLEYKTQVFVNHEGDLFRTRLTHSLEVSQIARTVARALCINEDLTEAITLAHDLGHTPFGHAGQDALNHCMQPWGGFEHNLQSLRVVDELEQKYAAFDGLNLTYETREGILKHCSRNNARNLGELGQRFIEGLQPGAEAQLANLADEIAYNNHDIDDGLRAGLITIEALRELALFNDHYERVRRRHADLEGRRLINEIVRGMIGGMVADLIATSEARAAQLDPRDIDAVRRADAPIIAFSEGLARRNRELKQFLYRHLYRHYRVHRMTTKAAEVIRRLFESFMRDPLLLPPQAFSRAQAQKDTRGEAGLARAVADYIAGMTDRYAIEEDERLHDPRART